MLASEYLRFGTLSIQWGIKFKMKFFVHNLPFLTKTEKTQRPKVAFLMLNSPCLQQPYYEYA